MGARREVVSAVTERYRSAKRAEKGRMLDALRDNGEAGALVRQIVDDRIAELKRLILYWAKRDSAEVPFGH